MPHHQVVYVMSQLGIQYIAGFLGLNRYYANNSSISIVIITRDAVLCNVANSAYSALLSVEIIALFSHVQALPPTANIFLYELPLSEERCNTTLSALSVPLEKCIVTLYVPALLNLNTCTVGVFIRFTSLDSMLAYD